MKADTTLSTRDFQVAGHTDKEPYGGQFLDNWGLSLMRARTVLVFLVSPDKGADARGIPTGGALDPDPLRGGRLRPDRPRVAAPSISRPRDDEKKNRRVELVLQPDVAEMLNLKEVTTPAAPAGGS